MAYDTVTKLIVPSGNVDGSSGNDADGNCKGNGLNAPIGLIMILMVSI